MPSFICRALSGDPIEVYGEGDQVMDMIYVTDVAKVLVNTLDHLDRGAEFDSDIEAGTGRQTTVMDIAKTVQGEVEQQTGSTSPITNLPMRPGEPPSSVVLGDPTTLAQVGLGDWELLPLVYGVENTVKYFREYLEK